MLTIHCLDPGKLRCKVTTYSRRVRRPGTGLNSTNQYTTRPSSETGFTGGRGVNEILVTTPTGPHPHLSLVRLRLCPCPSHPLSEHCPGVPSHLLTRFGPRREGGIISSNGGGLTGTRVPLTQDHPSRVSDSSPPSGVGCRPPVCLPVRPRKG